MCEDACNNARVAALFLAGLLGVWTAWTCHRARHGGLPASDTWVWAGLAAVFLIFAQLKLARELGWLEGMGEWLRTLAKQHGLYSDRRVFQIVVTIVVAVTVLALFLYGLIWMWHAIKRCRLAIGFAAISVGFVIIRFVSLHEIDLRQLGEYGRLPSSDY